MSTPPPEGSAPTPRELQVLEAFAIHENYAAAAESLGVSPETVRSALVNVRSRLGTKTSLGAYHRAVRKGLLRAA